MIDKHENIRESNFFLQGREGLKQTSENWGGRKSKPAMDPTGARRSRPFFLFWRQHERLGFLLEGERFGKSAPCHGNFINATTSSSGPKGESVLRPGLFNSRV